MATIHTESYFNPMARSSCNALGLMQLVAQTAGREAFKFVYGYDKIPQPETLYDPQKNILLGCAYLYILKNKYFSNIANIRSKLYCIIAGYNTGPGNVAFAFTGKKELLSASQVINDIMEPDSVYFLLQSGLPYYETRIYLKNVLGKMQLYSFPKIQIPLGGQL